jgi:hypothetical protein
MLPLPSRHESLGLNELLHPGLRSIDGHEDGQEGDAFFHSRHPLLAWLGIMEKSENTEKMKWHKTGHDSASSNILQNSR